MKELERRLRELTADFRHMIRDTSLQKMDNRSMLRMRKMTRDMLKAIDLEIRAIQKSRLRDSDDSDDSDDSIMDSGSDSLGGEDYLSAFSTEK
jgi:hypothetical protein